MTIFFTYISNLTLIYFMWSVAYAMPLPRGFEFHNAFPHDGRPRLIGHFDSLVALPTGGHMMSDIEEMLHAHKISVTIQEGDSTNFRGRRVGAPILEVNFQQMDSSRVPTVGNRQNVLGIDGVLHDCFEIGTTYNPPSCVLGHEMVHCYDYLRRVQANGQQGIENYFISRVGVNFGRLGWSFNSIHQAHMPGTVTRMADTERELLAVIGSTQYITEARAQGRGVYSELQLRYEAGHGMPFSPRILYQREADFYVRYPTIQEIF